MPFAAGLAASYIKAKLALNSSSGMHDTLPAASHSPLRGLSLSLCLSHTTATEYLAGYGSPLTSRSAAPPVLMLDWCTSTAARFFIKDWPLGQKAKQVECEISEVTQGWFALPMAESEVLLALIR